MKRTLLSWSSGKDSAWSLHLLRQQHEYEVVGLLTTFNQAANRVAMHAVRRSLVEAQAKAAGIPLWDVDLPWPCSNADYERIMKKPCKDAVQAGIECIAFGDLFLPIFGHTARSNWKILDCSLSFRCGACPRGACTFHDQVRHPCETGCVDPKFLAPEFVGREFDEQLLSEFQPDIDPCGENGEFHTFAYAGPMFQHDLSVEFGEIVSRDGFVFADLSALEDHHMVHWMS